MKITMDAQGLMDLLEQAFPLPFGYKVVDQQIDLTGEGPLVTIWIEKEDYE
jgi:hypothetical protein